jgi:hypothetical protein
MRVQNNRRFRRFRLGVVALATVSIGVGAATAAGGFNSSEGAPTQSLREQLNGRLASLPSTAITGTGRTLASTATPFSEQSGAPVTVETYQSEGNTLCMGVVASHGVPDAAMCLDAARVLPETSWMFASGEPTGSRPPVVVGYAPGAKSVMVQFNGQDYQAQMKGAYYFTILPNTYPSEAPSHITVSFGD